MERDRGERGLEREEAWDGAPRLRERLLGPILPGSASAGAGAGFGAHGDRGPALVRRGAAERGARRAVRKNSGGSRLMRPIWNRPWNRRAAEWPLWNRSRVRSLRSDGGRRPAVSRDGGRLALRSRRDPAPDLNPLSLNRPLPQKASHMTKKKKKKERLHSLSLVMS